MTFELQIRNDTYILQLDRISASRLLSAFREEETAGNSIIVSTSLPGFKGNHQFHIRTPGDMVELLTLHPIHNTPGRGIVPYSVFQQIESFLEQQKEDSANG